MTRQIKWGLFTSTGGMPSSHSASVTGLTTSIAYETGLNSPIFAVAAMFSFIVMYDASGVRYQAGQHAAILNQLRKDFQTLLHDLKKWPQMDGQEKNGRAENIARSQAKRGFFRGTNRNFYRHHHLPIPIIKRTLLHDEAVLENQFRLGVIVAAALLSLQKTFVAVASLSHR